MKRRLFTTLAATGLVGLTVGAFATAQGHGGMHGKHGKHGEMRAEMLEQFDADGDGKLSETERDAARLAHFSKIDADGNGTLTKQELIDHHTAKVVERVDKHFAGEDTNGDGVISADEFGTMRKARMEKWREHREARRAEMLEKFDADGDGELNDAERAAAKEAGYGRGHRKGGGPR